MKNKIAGLLGYIFCELSFRWFNVFDVPYQDEGWKWYHRVSYFLGEKSYSVGCYFYNIEESI
jgi:hypothetical protein